MKEDNKTEKQLVDIRNVLFAYFGNTDRVARVWKDIAKILKEAPSPEASLLPHRKV